MSPYSLPCWVNCYETTSDVLGLSRVSSCPIQSHAYTTLYAGQDLTGLSLSGIVYTARILNRTAHYNMCNARSPLSQLYRLMYHTRARARTNIVSAQINLTHCSVVLILLENFIYQAHIRQLNRL